jgi:hypothetical protein
MPFPPRCLLISAFVGTFAFATASDLKIPLVVPAGTPLRLEVEKTTFPKHVGDTVRARLAEPVYAFDKEVIPAGTEVVGHVTGFTEAPKSVRVQKILSGNFGSFRHPEVLFDTVLQKDGPPLKISASTESGSAQVVEMRATASPNTGRGVHGAVNRAKLEANKDLAKVRDFLHNPDKMDLMRSAALAHSPYQPVKIDGRSRFDALLNAPESFGSESVPADEISQLGRVAPQSGELRANLVTPLSSATTKLDAPVDALVMSPLFSDDHQLLLPAGTHLVGKTTIARPARKMHKNGQLRFAFQQVVLPKDVQFMQEQLAAQAQTVAQNPSQKIEAHLGGIVISRSAHVGLNEEGETKVEESKARFIGPALAIALATASTHQERDEDGGGGLRNNTGAQAGGGAIAFGLAGAVIGSVWRPAGIGFGFAGAARSVYKQFFAKGIDIDIPKNTSLLVDFGRTGKTLPKPEAPAAAQ